MSARKDKIVMSEIIAGMPVHYVDISAGCEAALITRVRPLNQTDLVAFSPGRQKERFFEYCDYSSDLGPGYVPGSWHRLEDHNLGQADTRDGPSEMVILAARHLDPAEGHVMLGHTMKRDDISALRQVLDYVGAMHAGRPRSL